MDKEQFVEELSLLRPGSTFLTLRGYCNSAGEIADYSVAFHIDYRTSLQRSIQQLKSLKLKSPLEKMAREELTESFGKSLGRMEDTFIEDVEDGYTRFFDDHGNYIKGVKMHNATATLHLYGMVVHKRVAIPGNYNHVNSKPLTVAKDKLRHLTPVGKFRQFRITPQQVDQIVVENLSLLPPIETPSAFI